MARVVAFPNRHLIRAFLHKSSFRITPAAATYPTHSPLTPLFPVLKTRSMSSTPAATSDGQTRDEAGSILKWASKDGEFRRQVSSFRDAVSTEPGAKFPAEKGRYHLYVSLACPWAHRTLIVRALKGLDDVIGVSCVHYLLEAKGWRFDLPGESTAGVDVDPVQKAQYLRELYFKAEPNYEGRFTVPVLWDTKTSTIVNNESSEIIRMLNTAFDEWSTAKDTTFYPPQLANEIDAINEWIYNQINNGVYKCGFATSQSAYDAAYTPLFEGLDRVEKILAKQTYLVGDQLTEADIRLFTTMIRFDPVYHTHFKCNRGTVANDYPNILKWMKMIYHLPRVKETVNMEHIKKHYYMSHKQINPFGIVPLYDGPNLD
ncbi:glutathione S-transferase omega-like 2 [Phlyctochytrium arcticum]|nr:glutathione S-transferase omega-like 2 [Phlyctochytrium arcticum]